MTRRSAKGATNAPSTLCLYFTRRNRNSATVTQEKKLRDSWKLVAGVLPAAIQRSAMVAVWKAKPVMIIHWAALRKLSLRINRYVE